MIKSILTVAGLSMIAVAFTNSTSSVTMSNDASSFSSPAAQVSWQTNANMSADISDVSSASAKSILGIEGFGYPGFPGRPTGTYNCSYDCSRSCTNTCSTNYRCRY